MQKNVWSICRYEFERSILFNLFVKEENYRLAKKKEKKLSHRTFRSCQIYFDQGFIDVL